MSLVPDLRLIHMCMDKIFLILLLCTLHVCITNHPSPLTAPATPTLQELSNELTSVQNWHLLGVKLGLKIHELGTIEKDYHGDNLRCKHEMLGRWLQSSKLPTWEAVTDALDSMGEQAIALKIRTKYCSSFNVTGMCLFVLNIQINSLTTVGYLLEVFLRLWIPFLVCISASAWS